MQDGLLPLFPLNLVLLPKATLPLHIFEDRYKEMIGGVVENQQEFGIVLAGDGGVVNTGCTATVDRVVEQYPDGRMDIIVKGQRRFELLLLNDQKPYLRGAVEFFEDIQPEDPPSPQVLARVIRAYEDWQEFDRTRAERETPDHAPELNDPLLSFQIARTVPDLTFRQMLLSTRSEAERLKQIAEFLPGFLAKQRLVAHIKEVAPKNGHGKRHVDE
ncbi:MAG: LON peptidase substrate-binding domain-containing protein [Bryobacteraceae bacterium]